MAARIKYRKAVSKYSAIKLEIALRANGSLDPPTRPLLKIMRGKNKDRSMIDFIINTARLNNGYFHMKSHVGVMKSMGFISIESSDEEAVRTMTKIINREDCFDKVNLTGKTKGNTMRRLKEFIHA